MPAISADERRIRTLAIFSATFACGWLVFFVSRIPTAVGMGQAAAAMSVLWALLAAADLFELLLKLFGRGPSLGTNASVEQWWMHIIANVFWPALVPADVFWIGLTAGSIAICLALLGRRLEKRLVRREPKETP